MLSNFLVTYDYIYGLIIKTMFSNNSFDHHGILAPICHVAEEFLNQYDLINVILSVCCLLLAHGLVSIVKRSEIARKCRNY